MAKLERRIVELKYGGTRYCVIGPRLAVDFHVVNGPGIGSGLAGLEMHYRTPPPYLADQEPFIEECWLTGERCWGDGTSHYATEGLLPRFLELGVERFWLILEREHDKRDQEMFGASKCPNCDGVGCNMSGVTDVVPPGAECSWCEGTGVDSADGGTS